MHTTTKSKTIAPCNYSRTVMEVFSAIQIGCAELLKTNSIEISSSGEGKSLWVELRLGPLVINITPEDNGLGKKEDVEEFWIFLSAPKGKKLDMVPIVFTNSLQQLIWTINDTFAVLQSWNNQQINHA